MKRVLIAPLAYKGTMSARRVAAAMARGACSAASGSTCSLSLDIAPFADGGDGSVDALVASGWERVTVSTRGADGTPGTASIATSGAVVAVEIANACGLARHLPRPLDPLGASSAGLGDAILAALDLDPATVIVFLGGSASTDGGRGMLEALGARVDETGISIGSLDPRCFVTRFVAATDVTSPLLGDSGAAHVFAPQKGADPAQVDELEERMGAWADALATATGVDARAWPGSGAAGGVGLALMAALGAQRESGAELLARELQLDARIAAADIVLTGEGSLDAQSLLGKGAVNLADRAHGLGVPVAMVCGRMSITPEELRAHGVASARSLTQLDADRAMSDAPAMAQAATASAVAELLA